MAKRVIKATTVKKATTTKRASKASTFKGYRKLKASELPKAKQAKLRECLINELTESINKQIKKEIKTMDLSKIEFVLRPGEKIGQIDEVGLICCTCGTCNCVTCVTADIADDIPIGVIKALGIKVTSLPQNMEAKIKNIATIIGREIK